MFYTYAYSDPRTKLPFYVGKGKGNRWRSHLSLCKLKTVYAYPTHFYRKLRKMLREGVTPQVVKVFEGSERACFQTEMTLIQSYGRRCDGGLLCNHTLGGEGVSGLKLSPKVREIFENANAKRRIPVDAFHPDTGEIIHRFPSMLAALSLDFYAGNISGVLNKPLTHKGLAWRTSSDLPVTPFELLALKNRFKNVDSVCQAVEAFNLDTGKIVHRFPSQLAAHKAGFDSGCISRVVNGRHKAHKGLGWRYQNEND